jgi:hypothetical protein
METKTQRDWLERLEQLDEVACPSCGVKLEVVDSGGRMSCQVCQKDVVIGLSVEDAGSRAWLVCTLVGLALAFGFSAFMFVTMLHDRGANIAIEQLWPLLVVGVVSGIGLIVVLLGNRKLERWRREWRWTVAIISLIAFPVACVAMLLIIP